MATRRELGRRAFLKSAALGATSLAVGGSACGGKASGRRVTPDGGGPPDGARADGSMPGADAVDASAVEISTADAGAADASTPDAGAADASTPDAGAADTSASSVEVAGEASVRRPPNLLFILADQWRAQAAGFAGDVNAVTPALDRLAGQSVTFAHTVSSTPVCCPYRATLLTGRYPTSTGVFLNDVNLAQDPHALAATFRQAGYDTGYIGKWHLDGQGCRMTYTPPERRQGFSRWAAIECTHDYNNSVYYAGDDGENRLTWPGYDAIAQTREMQRWLAERDPTTPFCYFLSWGPPHDPYNTAPAEFAAQFSGSGIALRPNVPPAFAAEARANLAGYYAHIAALDGCVADLLATLDALGLADDTIVVFTSDHGDMHRSQGQLWKQQPWDESILVPFLLRYPALLGRSPRTVPMRISTPDLMPTLVGLAGLPVPSVQGRDLSPVLRGERAADDEPALIMCVSPFSNWSRAVGGKEYRGLRNGRFTYARDLAGPWLLYDNLTDPYQMANLVGVPAYAAAQADLDARLVSKLDAIGDQFHDGNWYIEKWGYTVDPNDGAVPYYAC